MVTVVYHLGSHLSRIVGRRSLFVSSGRSFVTVSAPLPHEKDSWSSRSTKSVYSERLRRKNLRGIKSNISSSQRCASVSSERDESNNGSKYDFGTSAANAEHFDCVIAGGGLVGTTMAVALGQLGRFTNRKILLLETADKLWTMPPDKKYATDPNYSNRVVALSPGSKAFLEKLGVWEHVWRQQPVSGLQVWDALSDASISFHNPNFSQPVAYIVENAVLAHAINVCLKQIKNVTIKFGAQLKACHIPSAANPGEKALVALNNEEILATDLLIGADGFNSKVRNTMNSPYLGFNYDRTAVVATLRLPEKTENRIAWQRFLPSGGPIAMLPLSHEYSSLVWSTNPENAKRLLEMNSDAFVDAVNSAFWHEHSRSELVRKSCEVLSSLNLGGTGPKIFPPSILEVVDKSRASFPLGFGHSSYYVHRRTVLIGDAAHRVHPLAGQGLNLGIGDVETLLRVISNTAGIGEDIGDMEFLKEYETERQRHNLSIQGGIDLLHRLYSFEFPPIVALRTLGLSLVSSSDMLKKAIMSQAAA